MTEPLPSPYATSQPSAATYPAPPQYAEQPVAPYPAAYPPVVAPGPSVVYVQAPAPVAGPYVPQKSVGVAYVLWFFLGALGVHQFYLGKTGRGILYLFTLGGFLIGLAIDLFTMAAQVRQVNAQRAVGIR
ncbi:TM2 domain-containing protein [Nakamurella panacisegetis]|uniref:TM2 domain-containing protein n=1 Tax=Nakamurella panacisegetis TaxID=1090615 RepID=A0A1H0PVS3_9ACTN|nr:TM2 domain-containing protein [Nakamurella panacisegetis]SDP08646.1 TM2 domain-containing protein [Nakamurella panacisegetis]